MTCSILNNDSQQEKTTLGLSSHHSPSQFAEADCIIVKSGYKMQTQTKSELFYKADEKGTKTKLGKLNAPQKTKNRTSNVN